MAKLSVVSLFSGIGGLDYGLLQTHKFRIALQIEKDVDAYAALCKNQHSRNTMNADITKVDFSIVAKRPDVVIGGPPCQSFSAAGKRRGLSDTRGQMLWQFVRAVEELRPTAFAMENVPGLLWSGDPQGCVFRQLLQRLPKQYGVKHFVVNAADYGAPQARYRLVVVGILGGTPVFPAPTHGEGRQPYKTLGDAIGDLDYDVTDFAFSSQYIELLSQVPPGENWRALPEKLYRRALGGAFKNGGGCSGFLRRLSFSFPSPTLMGSPKHKSTLLCHPTRNRPLNIREYARIQGFPDSWEFSGTKAQQYLQIGNAVPVALGRAIGLSIVKSLEEEPDAKAA